MRNLWFKFVGIIILFTLAFSVTAPNHDGKIFGASVPSWFPDVDISLGLDLQGGTQLTYMIDLSKVPSNRTEEIVSGVQEVIRRRVDGLGVNEPVIQTAKIGAQRHLIVELPGVKNLEDAKNVVGKVVQLQFKEQQTEVTEEEKQRVVTENIKITEEANNTFSKAKELDDLKKVSEESTTIQFVAANDFQKIENLPTELQTAVKTGEKNKVYNQLIDTDFAYFIVKPLEEKVEQVKEVDASHILIAYQGAERANAEVTRTKEEAKLRAEEVIKKLNENSDFVELAKEYSDENTETGELPSPVKIGGSYVPAFTEGALAIENKDEFTAEPVESSFGYHIIKARDIRMTDETLVKYEQLVLIKAQENASGWKNTELTGEHFEFASAGFDQNSGQILVNISFNEKGTELFATITKRNLEKPLAIFLDDKPILGEEVYAPMIRSEITDGKAQISGNLNHKEAVELARNLNAGAIPAPISLVGQRTVGATLGEEALESGAKAGLIGIVLLFLYMIFFYRTAGILASIALSMYAVFLIAIFKLWPVTLTLAGVAGIIFSIGIAVDANILIFERMKEELKSGKSMLVASREGFDRAWSSIRDSNLSSLLICLVLFIFGSGMIRGFALTLSIGIGLSMFSAITVTRTFLMLLIEKTKIGKKWLIK